MSEGSGPVALITGGAGFLGSHLCDRLVAEGFRVVCVDNLLTGSDDNVAHLRENPNFTLLHHDVTEPIFLEELLATAPGLPGDARVDYVLHFASPASPKDYLRHPIHTLKVGALGTYHSLGLAKAHGAVFLLASSSEVYGDPEVSPQTESYVGHVNPTGPRSVYDESKRFAEAMVSAYNDAHGLDVRIARIFNTYGPRMRPDDGRAVPAFMVQAIREEPLTVFGDGSQTRSFCYIDDTLEGLYRLLMYQRRGAPSEYRKGRGQMDGGERLEDERKLIVNIGNPEEVTILQVANEVIEAAGSSSRIVFGPLPPDDPKTRKPDITRAKHLLGWEPKVSRHDGFKMIMPYLRGVVAALPPKHPSVS